MHIYLLMIESIMKLFINDLFNLLMIETIYFYKLFTFFYLFIYLFETLII